jgi:hypothetical protein
MDAHLDNKIRLNNKTEHESLYSWCLQEINSEGEQLGRDLIPWAWGFHFTASELRLTQGFEFGELSIFEDDDKESKEESEFQDTEVIIATLHPGICTDGKWLEDDPSFSMFGTNRTINDFTLRINAVEEEGEKEYCNVWGCVSYTAEIDFHDETTPDTIEIYLGLSKDRFNKIAELISSKTVDVVRVGISRVSGFYSDWSPSISTNSVKVLARGSDQEIEIPEGCEIEPPKLGEVGKFDLTLTTRSKLNPKQNFNTLNISKLFEDDYEIYEEEAEEEPEDINKLLLTKIARNQAELIKLKTPAWIIAILLGMLLLTLWR